MKKPVIAVALMLSLVGCSAPTPALSPTATVKDTLTGTITVFAAASVTDTFAQIADAFTAKHPGVEVVVNFGGSSGLATQIVQGAPADVFAAASGATMKTVTDAALTRAEPVAFATNTLEIAVPAGNPGSVTELADFANPDLIVALCAVAVPCGAAAQTVLNTAGIVASVDTYEQDVKAVLTKVELGEVDAGLVYTTDILAAGDAVEGIEFSESDAAVGTYPIAQLTASANPDAAAAFIEFVLSPAGKRILDAAGFGAP